tara:strand:- start:781 stop:936 length:156 start_codon:yes stop_codon:yes gene_type:complete
MSNKLVDICVNLTDDVFLGKEKKIIDAANNNNVSKMVLVGMIWNQAKKYQL